MSRTVQMLGGGAVFLAKKKPVPGAGP